MLNLRWQGPFEFESKARRGIIGSEAGAFAGVYVWAVETSRGLLPHYVGETKTSFARRHVEHFQLYASGAYSTRDSAAFAAGEDRRLHQGPYRRANSFAEYQPFIDEFALMARHLAANLRLIRIFVAELVADQRTRRRVEAGLVDAF